MTILFPESAKLYAEEFGACSATAWPRPPEDKTTVFTNEESCKIETLSVRYIDTYTTAVLFTIYVSGSCRYIICLAPSKKEKKSINISKEVIQNCHSFTSNYSSCTK